MEDVLSAPRGLSEWRSKRPSLDFLTLDSDKGTMFPPNNSDQTGLVSVNRDQDNDLGSRKEFLQEGEANLDNLLRSAGYFCAEDVIQLQGVTHSSPPHLPITEKPEEAEDNSDRSLSWLFGPGSPDLLWGSSLEGLPQEGSVQDQTGQGDEINLISLSVPSSPGKEVPRTSEHRLYTTTLLEDLLSGDLPFSSAALLRPRCLGEHQPQGVTQEPVGEAEGGASQSPESGAPPASGNKTPQSSPDIHHLHTDCASTPQDIADGSLPSLDSEFPGCPGNCSLSPIGPSPLTCPGEPLDSPEEKSEGGLPAPALVDAHPSHGAGECESPAPCSPAPGTPTAAASAPQPSETRPSDEGVPAVDELPGDPGSPEKACGVGVMDQQVATGQEDVAAVVVDLCSKTEEPPCPAIGPASPLNLTAGADSVTRPTTPNQAGPESDSAGSSSPEPPEWTSGKSQEDRRSLAKIVAPDSLPMVSTVTQKEESVSPLKAVFDALDQDGDGFVRIEEFMEFAAAYGADQVKDLTRFLDPSGLGVISFEDFHRGISTIGSGGPEPHLYDAHYSPGDGAVGCPEEYDEQNEVTDSAYLGSESTYSECETFTDEDTGALLQPEMHEEVETDSGIEATLHDAEDSGNRFSLNSELQDLSLVTVMGGGEEEHFEDFGENHGAELLEGGVEDQEEGPAEDGGPGALHTPEQITCSSLIMSPSSGKRLSSKKVARHLLQNSSMTLDTVSDLTRDILELADNDITDKVLLLERRVAELEKESDASGEVHARLRQENLQLVHRANALEEQLKEQEVYAEECLEQEERRHKEALAKMERDLGLELENLQTRMQQLDEENSELRSCVPCLRANIERLEEEKQRSQDELEEVAERLIEEQETRRKMSDKLSHERHLSQKEKESTQELIEDLRKQLEHLQLYKLEAEGRRGRLPSAGLQEYHTRTREAELEHEVKRLKQDNRSLKEQNDELNGQIINLSIQGAKNLMTAPFSDSLAAEINSVSRGELMEAVHKQEEINYRLQDYIDKIIVAIMECNPSILEVKY
ncbi:rab11 family-interacting protein 3 isoform X2 [Gadus macrocephalus]|uniref:rab11 family-interacting protein 3 isoform X2 n=1 Tax=Gadus macrocephalus TaxID=80720 RepID=UPI0028CB55B3|nr:rab11 family-interacting protein 3 isoform X2 [Gadus macrocephalus]